LYAPLSRDELAAMANVLKTTVLADRLAVKVPLNGGGHV
jgi:hypothetical protein